jgi:hypothetical protein
MASRTSLISSDISSGLAAAIRSAREIDVSDPMDAIRRIDVSHGIDVGREVVGDAAGALAETVARFPVRGRRRSRRRPALIGLAIGIIGAVVLAAWWLRRRPADDMTEEDERLDRDALERAADEGMGTAIGSPPDPSSRPDRVPVAMEQTVADARSH